MKWCNRCGAIFFSLIIVIAFAIATVSAHEGMSGDHASPPAASTTKGADNANQSAPSSDGMPETEMSWPTGDQSVMGHKARPKTVTGRIVAWLGVWHPAVIHFPVALTLTVAFLELVAAARRKPAFAASSKILLAIAVLGAFVAAPLGWANAGLPSEQEKWALSAHRWLGTLLPFLLLALWLLKRPAEQAVAKQGSRAYAPLLGLAVLLILAQAYLGGEVTHGANHMAF